MLTPLITLGQLLDAPGGRAIAERYLMIDLTVEVRPELRELLLAAFIRVTPGLRDDAAHRDRFWSEVDTVTAPLLLPPGRWYVDVLDTWEATVRRLPGLCETFVLVPLDAKPFQAIRLVETSLATDTD